ncbi:hypothetical protein ACIHEI_06350 [Kitasatospora sp. NPDC051984]|uniref:hypothetical protein n=1 Tax=Kitasatospora sp. NPDC051984 TaxID=3364059 RepID=UPI0037C9E185
MAKFCGHCGECGFKTGWTTEATAAQQLLDHYARRHPRVEPGGVTQIKPGNPEGLGCFAWVVILIVAFLALAMCARNGG